jgi:putrescine transport system substrate-binding protein
LIRRLVILAACVLSITSAHAQETTLRIYGWGDYIDKAALEKFTSETGIKTHYDTYNSLGELEATVALGHSGYDIIMPTNEPTLSRLVRGGVLALIDTSLVPNWKNLDPVLMRMLEGSDPGNKHGAIYLWGTFGLGIVADKVRALAPNAPLDSLDLLFKPENARRLQACAITMLDSPTQVVPTVLRYLGLRPTSNDPSDLAEVERTLKGIRPYIRTFSPNSASEALANGSTCLAMAYSGNVMQAVARVKAAKSDVDVRYIVPKEGAQVSFDVLAIPIDAPHKDAAHAFINFMLRPDIMADITNATRYANAVPASHPMIDPVLLADTNVFPTEEQMQKFVMPGSIPVAQKMARNRMWARFKDGR